MAMCTSRRACADRNSFRLYKTIDGKICQGKYIWTEIRCRNIVSIGKTCTECAVKLPKHKYQSSPKCDHGFIDGPYPSDSKLYGSPFYLKQAKDGWMIYEADENRAKEAQLNTNMPKKTVDTVAAETVTAAATVAASVTIKPKQPRKIKVAKNATETVLVSPSVQPVVEQKKVEAKFVEQMTVPIKIHDVITVKVKKIRCEGKDYYVDSVSGKAYTALSNGVGPYKGRYDPEAESLNTSFPDSDVE